VCQACCTTHDCLSTKTQRNGMVILMDLHDATLTSIDHGLMRLIFKVVLVSRL